MIKEYAEKIIKLNDKEIEFIENSIITLIVFLFIIGLIFGSIIGKFDEQNKITNKLISLSEKPEPQNYFKIDRNVYEIKKVKTSYLNDLSINLTHNYSTEINRSEYVKNGWIDYK